MVSATAALTSSYDYGEVVRSVVNSHRRPYAALDLARARNRSASGRDRLAWLGGGATAMGIGIWATHFKGMLAFRLPVSVEYHWPTILVSLFVAILASAVALYVASRQKMGSVAALTGSVIMGGGIARHALHRHGRYEIACRHQVFPLPVTCSILASNLVFSNFAADGVRFTRGGQMDCLDEGLGVPPSNA